MSFIDRADFVVLVTAHPDDEVMFFFPMLHTLLEKRRKRPKEHEPLQQHIRILCLSNGNYDGLGRIREAELHEAARVLGLETQIQKGSDDARPEEPSAHAESINILDIPEIQDNPRDIWDNGIICREISKFINATVRVDGREDKSVTNVALVTFDKNGVSGHINHICTFRGVQDFMSQLQNGQLCSIREGESDSDLAEDTTHFNIRAFSLVSYLNPFQKFFSLLIIFEVMLLWIRKLFNFSRGNSQGDSHHQRRIRYYSCNLVLAWKSLAAHSSQFVWYRRLFIIFSRYTYANSFREVLARDTDMPLRDKKGSISVNSTSKKNS